LGKLVEKIVLQIFQKNIGERNLFNASQFGFRARHSTTLQCMRLADHVTINFDNKMSTAAVFLDIEKAFDTTSHAGLLYKLTKLNFSTRITKLVNSFLFQRKFSLGRRRNVYTKVYESRGATRFHPVSHSMHSVY
jgi:hypothetical protein